MLCNTQCAFYYILLRNVFDLLFRDAWVSCKASVRCLPTGPVLLNHGLCRAVTGEHSWEICCLFGCLNGNGPLCPARSCYMNYCYLHFSYEILSHICRPNWLIYLLFWCSDLPIFSSVHVAGYSQCIVTVTSNSRITSHSMGTMAGKGRYFLKINFISLSQITEGIYKLWGCGQRWTIILIWIEWICWLGKFWFLEAETKGSDRKG